VVEVQKLNHLLDKTEFVHLVSKARSLDEYAQRSCRLTNDILIPLATTRSYKLNLQPQLSLHVLLWRTCQRQLRQFPNVRFILLLLKQHL
jgi:hypothetical protein